MNLLTHRVIKNLVVAATLVLAAVSSWVLTDLLTEHRTPVNEFTAVSPLRR